MTYRGRPKYAPKEKRTYDCNMDQATRTRDNRCRNQAKRIGFFVSKKGLYNVFEFKTDRQVQDQVSLDQLEAFLAEEESYLD